MVKPLTNPFAGRQPPLGSLVNVAGRVLNSALDARLVSSGFGDLGAAHAPIFMAIDAEGSSVTELARALRTTKQATGELIRHLQSGGYVEVEVDQRDRRARKVALTERGWDALRVGVDVIADFDHWLDGVIGADRVAEFRDNLTRIVHTDPAGWT